MDSGTSTQRSTHTFFFQKVLNETVMHLQNVDDTKKIKKNKVRTIP